MRYFGPPAWGDRRRTSGLLRRAGRHISVMDRDQIEQLRSAGADIRRRRQDQSATFCADCFQPIAPGASVTVVGRSVFVPASTCQIFGYAPAHDRWLTVPICLTCWLINVADGAEDWVRGFPHLDRHAWEQYSLEGIERFRCKGCGRPMRVYRPIRWQRQLHDTERVCCDDCRRAMINTRARERRRVSHTAIKCEVCRKSFVPTRSDAHFCSNRCCQQRHRRRRPRTHKSGSVSAAC